MKSRSITAGVLVVASALLWAVTSVPSSATGVGAAAAGVAGPASVSATPASVSATPASVSATPASALQASAAAEVHHYAAELPPNLVVDCTAAAGNPAPGTPAWTLRDLENQYCAVQRIADEVANPAFGATFTAQTPDIFGTQTLQQLGEPGHLHVTLGQLVPGGSTADPFRSLDLWEAAGRGAVTPISFTSSDGATLNGNIFEPPGGGRDPYSHRLLQPPYPGVVITTGSIQGYQQLYFWAAEGLAEAGYMVMTYDVQGQGDSDTLPPGCVGDIGKTKGGVCPGVPYQQNYNFFQGAEDALNYFVSTPTTPYKPGQYNPEWSDLDPREIGIAGHSLGAAAVSELAQCDTRVKAVVAWDNLAPATGPCSSAITIPAADTNTKPSLKTPALGLNSEYFLNPEPMGSPPDPHAKDGAFRQLTKAGTDTMQVALRSSMHLEYSYIPYILPASQLGERVAFYYTLAWFDYYLRHMPSGYTRLVAKTFDNSSDVHSIGAGLYSPAAALADPLNFEAGNIPSVIGGLPVDNRLSFYYESEYSLTRPGPGGGPAASAARVMCVDMRAGCPGRAPTYP